MKGLIYSGVNSVDCPSNSDSNRDFQVFGFLFNGGDFYGGVCVIVFDFDAVALFFEHGFKFLAHAVCVYFYVCVPHFESVFYNKFADIFVFHILVFVVFYA